MINKPPVSGSLIFIKTSKKFQKKSSIFHNIPTTRYLSDNMFFFSGRKISTYFIFIRIPNSRLRIRWSGAGYQEIFSDPQHCRRGEYSNCELNAKISVRLAKRDVGLFTVIHGFLLHAWESSSLFLFRYALLPLPLCNFVFFLVFFVSLFQALLGFGSGIRCLFDLY